MKKIKNNFIAMFLFGMCGVLFSAEVLADPICLLDATGDKGVEMDDCVKTDAPYTNNSVTVGSGTSGVRINQVQAVTPIDKHEKCRFLGNTSSKGHFVPYNTLEEWNAFIDYANDYSSVLSAVPCALPFSGINISTGLYIGGSSTTSKSGDTGYPPRYAVSLPYAKEGETRTASHTFSFSCTERYVTGYTCSTRSQSWNEAFTFTATAQNSDALRPGPSWLGTSTRVSGTRPAACSRACNPPSRPTSSSSSSSGSSSSSSGSVNCSYGFTNGQQKTASCPCGANNARTPTKWGLTVWSMRNFDSHHDGCSGNVTARCFNGTLSLVSASCRSSNYGR